MERLSTKLEELGMQLLEVENVLIHVAQNSDAAESFITSLEQKVRALREVTNDLWATDMIAHKRTYTELGIQAFVGDGYLEMEFPYSMIAKSNMFRLFTKRIASVGSLISVTTAWHYLMDQIVHAYGRVLPFSTPLMQATVDVTILTPDRRQRDPDHFWYRPLQDGLVQAGLLSNDTTGHVDLSFHYGSDKKSPGVIVQIRPAVDRQTLPIRSPVLVPANVQTGSTLTFKRSDF